MLANRKWLGISLGILAISWLLFSITFNLNIIIASLNELGDFGSFIAAGLNLKNGINPYDSTSSLIYEPKFPLLNAGGKMPNLNPPIGLLAFELISSGDHFQTLNIWRVVSFLVYSVSVLLLANEYKPGPLRVLWTFALAGLWHTIGLGQIYTLLLLLSTLAWLSSRRNKHIQTGIFLGLLVSIKPNFILWILLFALQKNWKTVFSALIVMGLCAVAPLTRMSPDVYLQWFEASRVGNNVLTMPGNSSLFGLTSRMGIAQIGAILAVLLLVITTLAFIRNRDVDSHPDLVNSIGIFLSLLISPISWVGYTIITLPFFLSKREWDYSTFISAAILTLPFNFTKHFYYYYGRLNFIFWGWWYGIALAICISDMLVTLWKQNKNAFDRV